MFIWFSNMEHLLHVGTMYFPLEISSCCVCILFFILYFYLILLFPNCLLYNGVYGILTMHSFFKYKHKPTHIVSFSSFLECLILLQSGQNAYLVGCWKTVILQTLTASYIGDIFSLSLNFLSFILSFSCLYTFALICFQD